MLEIGSHVVAHMLDLAGTPDDIQVQATNPTNLPTGQTFFRRWQVNAVKRQTAIELRFSFVPGFGEYSIHVRGSLGSATVDFERNTYTVQRHGPRGDDFDRYATVRDQARSLIRQGRRTLANYILSKLPLGVQGSPYGASIAGALNAFTRRIWSILTNASTREPRLKSFGFARRSGGWHSFGNRCGLRKSDGRVPSKCAAARSCIWRNRIYRPGTGPPTIAIRKSDQAVGS